MVFFFERTQLEKLISKNYYLHQSARDGYRSYLQAYASYSLKKIFDVHALDLSKVGRAFGFSVPPKVNISVGSGMKGGAGAGAGEKRKGGADAGAGSGSGGPRTREVDAPAVGEDGENEQGEEEQESEQQGKRARVANERRGYKGGAKEGKNGRPGAGVFRQKPKQGNAQWSR